MQFSDVRQKYPQYDDMSDDQLAGALHKKYYADISYDDFAGKVGLGAEASNEGVIDKITGAFGSAVDTGKDIYNSFFDSIQDTAQNANTLIKLGVEDDQFTPEQLDERRQQRIWAGPGAGEKDDLSPVGQEVLAGLPNELAASLHGAGGDLTNFLNNASKALGFEGDGPVSDVSNWFYKNEKGNEQAALNEGLDLSRLNPGEGSGAAVHGFKSAVNQAPMLTLGVAGKPMAALAAMGLQVAGDEQGFDELIKHGHSPQAAFGIQSLKGGIEAGTEKLPLERLMKKWGSNWLDEVVKYAAVESGTEITAEGLNALTDKYISGIRKDMTMDDFVGDVKTMMAQLPYAMGAQTAAMKAAQVPVNKLQKMAEEKAIDSMFDDFNVPLNKVAGNQAVDSLNPQNHDPSQVDPNQTTQRPDQVGPAASPSTAAQIKEQQDQNVVDQLVSIFAAQNLGGKASGAEQMDELGALTEEQRILNQRSKPKQEDAAYQQHIADLDEQQKAEELLARDQRADQDIETSTLIDDVNNQPADIPNAMAEAFNKAGFEGLAPVEKGRRQLDVKVPEEHRQDERRNDTGERKRVDQMTSKEMATALRTSDKNELSNERAYNEDKKLKHQSFMDIDDFKDTNTRLTYEGADVVLGEVGKIMKKEAGSLNIPYHLHGDEFITQSDDPKALEEFSQRVQNKLKSTEVEITLPGGRVIIEKGIGVSYGIGQSKEQAESQLSQDKQRRKESGERVGVRPEAGGESAAVHGATTEGQQNNQSIDAGITLPPNYSDPRFSRNIYRDSVKDLVSRDLTAGGGIAVVPDENYVRGEGDSGNAAMKRTPSLNPQWAQDLMASENITVKQIQSLVDKALAGETLGVRQQRVLTSLLDQIESERTSDDNIEYAKQARREAVWLRKYGPVEIYEKQAEQFGELFEESEYDEEWDAETRSYYEIATEATGIDPVTTEAVIEKATRQDWSISETVKALYDEVINKQNTEQQRGPQVSPEEDTGQSTERPKADAENTETLAPSDEGVSDSGDKKTPAEKIEDVGEKIGGARKDVWSGFREQLSEELSDDDLIKTPLSKLFPEPDYTKLAEQGIDVESLALIKVIRDEVPRKPSRKGYKMTRYLDGVKLLRDSSKSIMDDTGYAEKFMRELRLSKQGLYKLADRVDLMVELGFPAKPISLKGIDLHEIHFSIFHGEKNVNKWLVENKSKNRNSFGNMGGQIAATDTREEAVEALKAYLEREANAPKGKKAATFKIYRYRHGSRGWIIGKKLGRNNIDIKEGFESSGDARTYMEENHDEIVKEFEKRKEIPAHRKSANDARLGEDYRAGKDVNAEEFRKTFGFRGVEFGNWVEQDKRQADINDAYDGLMDLSKLLDIPPEAISLNSELGIAFGARGKGGKDPAKAHYESGSIVINLTKKNGAGSLAHEWFHGLDNYFSRMRGDKADFITERPYELMDKSVRKEMMERFKGIMTAINDTKLPGRAAVLDGRKSKAYWSTDLEMAARTFESYIINKLKDNGLSNDYLANIVSPEYWTAAEALGLEAENSYPYILEEEMEAVNEAYDAFFDTVETKQTDKGTALYKKSPAKSTGQSAQTVQDNIDRLSGTWKNAPKITVVQSQSDLPGDILDQANESDIIDGVFYNDQVYLVADNLKDEKHVEFTLLHESLLHYGARQTFGEKDFNDILVQLWYNDEYVKR